MNNYKVYCLCDEQCNVLYVGSTTNLGTRVRSHITDNKVFNRVFYSCCESESDMLRLEKGLIVKFKPKLNRTMYLGNNPTEHDIQWQELDNSTFLHLLLWREPKSPKMVHVDENLNYYGMHKDVLKLHFLISRKICENGVPERFEFTGTDKLIYAYMKIRFDYCAKAGIPYMETHAEVAEAVGVNVKTISRFSKKMKTHGFFEYTNNNAGNRVHYTTIGEIL